MIQADGSIRTVDMTFAVVLSTQGYMMTMEKNGREAVWVIDAEDVDEFAHELAEDYLRNAVRIEPKRFMRELRAVRKELYDFLGVSKNPAGTPIEPSA